MDRTTVVHGWPRFFFQIFPLISRQPEVGRCQLGRRATCLGAASFATMSANDNKIVPSDQSRSPASEDHDTRVATRAYAVRHGDTTLVTYLWTHGANLGRPHTNGKSLELLAGAMVFKSRLGERVDLTRLAKNGKLTWDVPEGRWRVFALYSNTTSHFAMGGGFPGKNIDAPVVDHLASRGADALISGYGK